jgi:hypothetical protein
LLILLATLVAAGLYAPNVIQFVRPGQPRMHRKQRPVRTTSPIVRHPWLFDFSMGPILELIEQSLSLEPFDLRRPLRIPFAARPQMRGGDILLADPGSYLPPLVPANASPLPSLPSPQIALLPGLPPFTSPGGSIPNGEPDFDPDLVDGDEPGAPRGDPPPRPPPEEPPPVQVPEPATPLLLGSALLALAWLRRRRSPLF